jgi:hypothetical protein
VELFFAETPNGRGAEGNCRNFGVKVKLQLRRGAIQSKGGDINKPCDLWIIARFGNHGAAVRVANENHGTAMRRQNALGYGHIIRERYRWILNYADGLPVLFADFVDFFPARAIDEATVDENYCLYSRIRFAIHNISFLCFVVCRAGLAKHTIA